MSGIVVIGGLARQSATARFDMSGVSTDTYLNCGGVSSTYQGYTVMSPSAVIGFTARVTDVISGSPLVFNVYNNAGLFFTKSIIIGQMKYSETFTIGAYPVASLDELTVAIVGTGRNVVVQLKIA